MQVTLLHENLQQAINDVQKSISSRPALPILACILLKAEAPHTVTFSATDLNIGVTSAVSGKVKEAGKVAVPAKIFIDFISTLQPGEVSLSHEGNTLTISTQDSNATIQCFSADDYPLFPTKEGQEVTLPFEHFMPAVQLTSYAASVDEARPVLTSLLFSLGEQMKVVGTDGFRLAVFTFDFASSPVQLLLPAKALSEVLRIASRKKVETVSFTVSEKLKQVFFTFESVEVLVRLLEGDFPPYQKIIPPSYATQVVFDGNDFAQKMKVALVFARESSGIIRLKVLDDHVILHSSSTTLGTQETRVSAKILAGGNTEIAFNAKYLQEFLSSTKPEQIWFGMNESLKPALFRPAEKENYQYIVMPFRVNQ